MGDGDGPMTVPARATSAGPLPPRIVDLPALNSKSDAIASAETVPEQPNLNGGAEEVASVRRVERSGDATSAPALNGGHLTAVPMSQTATQLLKQPSLKLHASFLSRAVDGLLSSPGGAQGATGLRQGTIIEVSGPPGVGKTAGAIGLALDTRRAAVERGDDGLEVLLVDTEGGISHDRILAAAETVADGSSLSAATLLEGISYMRVHTIAQFVAFVRTLSRFFDTHPLVKLVVVDTLSFHLRSPSLPPDKQSRSRILQKVKEEAQRCAFAHDCSFVFNVQMATKFYGEDGIPSGLDSGGDRAVLASQLGDAYLPKTAYRMQLAYAGGTATAPAVRRIATLLSAPPSAAQPARFPLSQHSQPFSSQGARAGDGPGLRRVEYRIRDGLMDDVPDQEV